MHPVDLPSQHMLLIVTLYVPQRTVGVIATLLIDQTALVYSHLTGLLDRYLRETRVGGFVLARAANIFPPPEEGSVFLRRAGVKPAKPGNPA